MSLVTEIAPNVLALTDIEPVRDRSWRPADVTGFEPFNKYLILEVDRALLIDTGPRAHRDSLVATLARIVGTRHLTVMISRSEPDAISNVGAVVDAYPDLRVIGIMKNLPLLGLVDMAKTPRAGLIAERITIGQPLTEYGFPDLTPLEPLVKTLSTVWLHHRRANVLFTSDSFSGDLLAEPDTALLRRAATGHPEPDELRRHILCKFDWIAEASLERHQARWTAFFESCQPTILAPGLGRIATGEALVQKLITAYALAIFGVTEPRIGRA